MKRRIRFVLLLITTAALCLLGLRWLNRLPGQFSNALDSDLYNCSLTLHPNIGLSPNHAVRLTLEWEDWREYTRLAITSGWIEVTSAGPTRLPRRWRVPSGVTPGTPYNLLVMRRGDWLGVLHDGTLLFDAQVPHPPGACAAITAETGWRVAEVSIERQEPVAFADNFMRTKDEPGNWTLVNGQWHLLSAWDADPHGNSERFTNNVYAQNPFAWLGRATTSPAICTSGKTSWEDYTLSFSVQPRDGAVGALVNLIDARNGVLARWSAANDPGPDGGQLILYQLTDGQRRELARSPGGYLPGLWYKMSVVSGLMGVQVLIDGIKRLSTPKITPWHGAIGLYAEGKHGAVFNNLTTYGRTLNVDMIEEAQQFRLSQRILDDKEMQKWAKDWEEIPGQPGAHHHQRSFFGDQRLVMHVAPIKHGMGQLLLVLNGDGEDLSAGYRATVERGFDGKAVYTLYRNREQLARAVGRPMNDDEEYTLRFWRQGERLWLEQDGVTVVDAQQGRQLPGTRAAYRTDGCFAGGQDAVVLCRHVLDYQFTEAPVDWLGEGTWAPTIRWACDPRWSFLGGWSHGDAVLWHKQRFSGDQTFEAYVAPMMEYPRARVLYGERYCDMCLTICGDGHDPRSGYAAIYGAPDELGNRNRRTVLLRNGVVVASLNLCLPPKDEVHKQWSHLEMNKHDNCIDLFIDGQRVLSYTDPHPIDGGVPALWTTDNGLTVARARLYFANPPQPRRDNWLTIDAPDYPEWCNVGSPLTLSFPNACAASGKPVTLYVAPRGVPAGEAAPQVRGHAVTFAPRKVGEHWYQVYASDGMTNSPSMHLLIPTFNPTQRRDDSHALVLYRFNEGHGNRVHDHSRVVPPADILIPAGSPAYWLSGKGLALPKPTILQTAENVHKLNAIMRTQAATIECWVSYNTLYPPTTPPIYWEGNVVSWENTVGRRNFCYGFHSFNIEVGALAGSDLQKFNPKNCWTPHNHIGLQHQVVTWDGHYTRFYVNGRLVDEKHYKWEVESWLPDMPLTFGNEPDGQRPFLGTYYLLAIHDCALGEAQIQRNYQAGPSAQ